jgi:hypothetical protein
VQRQGLGWRTEPAAVQSIVLKIYNLGEHATEDRFSQDEVVVIHNLIDHRKVRATDADDLPPVFKWSRWLKMGIPRPRERYHLKYLKGGRDENVGRNPGARSRAA